MNFYDISKIESKKLAEGVSIQLIPGERMTMVVFTLQKGAQIPEHAHPHEQMGLVSSGKMRLVIDGEERVLASGDAWRIPGEMFHSGECLVDDTVVVEFFSPPREDLMAK